MTGIALASIFIAYAILVLILWLGWERAEPYQDHENIYPSVSLVISLRNESDNILNLLDDIVSQSYPKEKFELIIIDDHSTDPTSELISGFIKQSDLNIELLALSEKEGKKAALHKGIQYASNDLILTTDGDCRVGTHWIASMTAYFNSKSTQLVSGPVRIYPQTSFISRLQASEFATLISSGAATIAYGWPTMANGANLAFRKESYLEVSERYERSASGDDVFLLHKIKHKYPRGVEFNKDKFAVVDTPASHSITAFFQQRKRWVAKWSEYRHWPTKLLAVAIFLINFIVLALPVVAVLKLMSWVLAANLFVVKFVFEFWYIKTVQKFFDADFRFYEFVFLALIYPFYVVFTAISGQFGKNEWKGRKTI